MFLLKTFLFTILTTLFLAASATPELNSTKKTENLSQVLKKSLKKRSPELLKSLSQKKFLKHLYKKNNYKLFWIKNQKLNEHKTRELIEAIKGDLTLNKESIILNTSHLMEKELDKNLTTSELLHNELQLTNLYYNFLKHILYGEIEWKPFQYKLKSLKKSKINASWVLSKPKIDIEKLLIDDEITKNIKKITPKKFGYKKLLYALSHLKELQAKGAWKKLPKFKKLKLGSSGDLVLKLRARLIASGDYRPCTQNGKQSDEESNSSKPLHIEKDAIFDACLDKAVKHFQKRHGLMVDGIVGKGTQRVLNLSVEDKINTVLLNIDRIKWLPRDEHERYIVVNIPEFMLHYIENNQTKQKLPVIVGDPRHPTPIFSEKLSYVVLNPYWKIPEGIVKREIIPAMIKNPDYLRKQGIEAHTTWDENSPAVDVSYVYWEDYLLDKTLTFPYRLMQPPGKHNALGKIKFKFPNRFAVYLHDTPTKYLFKKSSRAFSHGCVRLSKPQELLETIATFNPRIDMKKTKKVLKGKRKKLLNLKEKLPINLVYLTAGVNDKGELEFRNDIYKYDKYQKRTLR